MVKIHERKFVSSDPDKCVGCQVCEYACSMVKEKAFNPLKSRIRVVRVNQLANMAVTCRLCEDPPCIVACPRDALTQSEETGAIIVDKDKCNGCGWCIEACDYGHAASRRKSRLRLRPVQRQGRTPMREVVSRRSPDASDERCAGAESKNQRSKETLPRSKEINKQGKLSNPLSLNYFIQKFRQYSCDFFSSSLNVWS
jgi:Fe-S-cluster-containing dehydrogenase component